MSAHQRQLIRKAVQTALIGSVEVSPGVFTYATPAGPRVESTRVFEWRVGNLPAISVYSLEETTDPGSSSSAPIELDRRLSLAVELAVEAGSNPDDAIDAFCKTVEKVMHKDDTFGGVCSFSILESTTIEIVASEKYVGQARLIYSVRYFTYAPEAEDTTLDSFTSAGVAYKVEGPTMPPADDAEDEITPAQ